MAIVTMIIGESGTGKSTSMRELDASETLLIQSIKKPLPFRSNEWNHLTKDGGNIFVCDDSNRIINAITKTKRKIIVIDDFQYILANEFMRGSEEKGYEKFTKIARHAWDILNACNALEDDVRVYLLSHSETTDFGKVKLKTIGRLLDDKITLEGMVTIVLRTLVINGQYVFSTTNNGNDTVKSPIGLFDSEHIDNNLKTVDEAIKSYYLT